MFCNLRSPDATSREGRLLGPGVAPLSVGSGLCCLLSVLVLSHDPRVLYVTFLVQAAFRSTLYSLAASFLAVTFPGELFGVLYGTMVICGGVVGCLQYALYLWAEASLDSILHVSHPLTFVHPLHVLWLCRRAPSNQDPPQRPPVNGDHLDRLEGTDLQQKLLDQPKTLYGVSPERSLPCDVSCIGWCPRAVVSASVVPLDNFTETLSWSFAGLHHARKERGVPFDKLLEARREVREIYFTQRDSPDPGKPGQVRDQQNEMPTLHRFDAAGQAPCKICSPESSDSQCYPNDPMTPPDGVQINSAICSEIENNHKEYHNKLCEKYPKPNGYYYECTAPGSGNTFSCRSSCGPPLEDVGKGLNLDLLNGQNNLFNKQRSGGLFDFASFNNDKSRGTNLGDFASLGNFNLFNRQGAQTGAGTSNSNLQTQGKTSNFLGGLRSGKNNQQTGTGATRAGNSGKASASTSKKSSYNGGSGHFDTNKASHNAASKDFNKNFDLIGDKPVSSQKAFDTSFDAFNNNFNNGFNDFFNRNKASGIGTGSGSKSLASRSGSVGLGSSAFQQNSNAALKNSAFGSNAQAGQRSESTNNADLDRGIDESLRAGADLGGASVDDIVANIQDAAYNYGDEKSLQDSVNDKIEDLTSSKPTLPGKPQRGPTAAASAANEDSGPEDGMGDSYDATSPPSDSYDLPSSNEDPGNPYSDPPNPNSYVPSPVGPSADSENPLRPNSDPASPVDPYGNPENPVEPNGDARNPIDPYSNPASSVDPNSNPTNPARPNGGAGDPVDPYNDPEKPVGLSSESAGPVGYSGASIPDPHALVDYQESPDYPGVGDTPPETPGVGRSQDPSGVYSPGEKDLPPPPVDGINMANMADPDAATDQYSDGDLSATGRDTTPPDAGEAPGKESAPENPASFPSNQGLFSQQNPPQGSSNAFPNFPSPNTLPNSASSSGTQPGASPPATAIPDEPPAEVQTIPDESLPSVSGQGGPQPSQPYPTGPSDEQPYANAQPSSGAQNPPPSSQQYPDPAPLPQPGDGYGDGPPPAGYPGDADVPSPGNYPGDAPPTGPSENPAGPVAYGQADPNPSQDSVGDRVPVVDGGADYSGNPDLPKSYDGPSPGQNPGNPDYVPSYPDDANSQGGYDPQSSQSPAVGQDTQDIPAQNEYLDQSGSPPSSSAAGPTASEGPSPYPGNGDETSQQKPVVTVIDDGSRDPTAKGSSSQGPPPGIFDIPGKTSPTSTNSNARGGSNSPSIRLPSEAFQNPFQNPSSPLGNRRDQFGNSNPAYVGTSLFSEGFIDSPGGVSPSLAGVPKGPDPVDEGAYQIFPGFQQFEKTAGSGIIFGQPSGGSRRGAGSGIGQVDFGTRNAGLNRGGAANGGFFNSPSTQAAGGVFSQNFLANPGRTNFITPRRSRGFEGIPPPTFAQGFGSPTPQTDFTQGLPGSRAPNVAVSPAFSAATPSRSATAGGFKGFGSDDGQFGFPGSFGSFNDQNFDKNGFDNSEFTDDLFNGKGSTSEDSETTSSSSSGNSSAPA
ncbi:hypothetical protein BaRGS_00027222 [Batillaria attramentaria]|uniref:Uncharacterized protein n=1 Tax=Batillaria attramentaria TaxID=370345 RepID=A0ABD0K3X6_9CAEN